MENKLVKILIGVVIGLALLPVIISTVSAIDVATLSTAEETLINLIPTLYIIVLLVGVVSYLKFG